MRRVLVGCSLLTFAWFAPAPLCAAQDPVLANVHVGMSQAELLRALSDAGVAPSVMANAQPQALRLGLLESRLLELWNHFELTPRNKQGELDENAFQTLVRGERGARSYVFTLGARGLVAACVRIPVPVDTGADPRGGWSKERLGPLSRALAELDDGGLKPIESDSYGNHFAWRGQHKGGGLRVLYVPADDELIVLVH